MDVLVKYAAVAAFLLAAAGFVYWRTRVDAGRIARQQAEAQSARRTGEIASKSAEARKAGEAARNDRGRYDDERLSTVPFADGDYRD